MSLGAISFTAPSLPGFDGFGGFGGFGGGVTYAPAVFFSGSTRWGRLLRSFLDMQGGSICQAHLRAETTGCISDSLRM